MPAITLRSSALQAIRATRLPLNASRSRTFSAAAAPACAPAASGPFGAQQRWAVSAVRTELSVGAAMRRGFRSTACARGQGESDSDLSSRIAQEINYERETAAAQGNAGAEPEFVRKFKSDSPWNIEDKAGSDEVALTRSFGNESIRVLFSIGDIDTTDPANDMEDEAAGGESEAQAGADGEEEAASFPVRCAITIAKPDQGALTIDAQAQDGIFSIENISFYKDSKLATELTAEADWARRGLYIGPQFETLDENVQSEFERFLEERGIATSLALFIPNFAEYKEQREYCNWLESVKAFVDA